MKLHLVEPVSPLSRAFYGLREVGSRLRHFKSRWIAKKRSLKLRISAGNEVLMNYGWMGKSSVSRLPIGGEIKLIPLREKYPERFNDFNLIYLVSSALPPHAEELVATAKARGARLVWNQNGIAYPGCYGDFYPWFNLRMITLRAQADYIFNQSEFSRISAERYLGRSVAPSQTCFNPVDTDRFSPSDDRPGETWRILAAGTSLAFYRTRSALDTLKELLSRRRNVHLTIAGQFRWRGGPDQVREAMKGLEKHITILPPFRQEDAPAIYRRADVLLHTKFHDPCPTVPIEAMSCGIPVVGTRSGGMPELVPMECGVLVPVSQGWMKDVAGSPSDLADAVEHVMGHRPTMSQASREHAVRSFELRNWLERHERVFRQLLDYR